MTSPAATVTSVTDPDADDLPFSAKTRGRIGIALFALLAYVPLLLTDVGKIAADSKSYFYLDPGRLLASAASMWDPSISMGTVSYQTLGYLFPIGPFYWLFEQVLNVPPWITERIWLGTLLLAAGLGVRYLLRTLGVRGPGIAVGMLAYAFTPYVIQFSARTSVLLGPWAATPWMAALVILGLRRGGWKYPALLAVVVQLSGSVNAATLGFALLAPALWIVYSVWVVHETEWRRAWGLLWRSGVLMFVTSLWWMSALAISSAYGRNILRFTETVQTTASTTYPIEVLRGVGYWFFYGKDARTLWVQAATSFTRNPLVIFASMLLPALALLAAVALRWRYRLYFVLLVLVGFFTAIASSPYDHPSPIGALFKAFATGNTVGLALRNSARAVPLIALGLACLLAVGVSALHQRLAARGRTVAGIVVAAVIVGMCLVNAPGIWSGSYYSTYAEWKSVPDYWQQAAKSLGTSQDSRVLVLPGSPFATYTWGSTIDPVLPGLTSKPTVTRDQIPYGSEATANLLQAVDGRLQNNVLDPNALAPIARLMGADDVLLDMDFQTDRYGLIPADVMWNTFTERAPTGLDAPRTYGTKIPGPKIVEPGDAARPPLQSPPPLAVLPVKDPLSIVRTKSAADPIVVDGDAEGLVDIASAGLLDARRLVLYSPTYEKHPATLRKLAAGASLIVTDSNRKRAHATTLINNYGPTEGPTEKPLEKNVYDQRLDVFPDQTQKSQTVTLMHGVKSVLATYGNQAFGVRASFAIDGDPKTSWVLDNTIPATKQRLEITLDKPITTDHIRFFQPLKTAQGRWITGVTLKFDGHHAVHEGLDNDSRDKNGQVVTFSKRTFSKVEIDISQVHDEQSGPQNPVGFVEVRMSDDAPGATRVRASESTRMPEDLLDAMGTASIDDPLTFSFSRDQMDDQALRRQFTLPTARSFTVSGNAEIGALAGDAYVDKAVGLPSASAGGITAISLAHFGDPLARASSAIDGDPSTAWNTPLGAGRGYIQLKLAKAKTFDHLDLRLVNDGRHSLPTKVRIESEEDGSRRNIDLRPLPHHQNSDGTVSIPVTFDAIHGKKITFTILDMKPRVLRTSAKQKGVLLPSAVAELGLPGVQRQAIPANMPTTCHNDLLTIDGKPFPVRVTGTTADALRPRLLTVTPCGKQQTITLSAGKHVIDAAETPNSTSGIDVEHLIFASGAGGTATAPAIANPDTPLPAGSQPSIDVVHQNRTSMTLHVGATSKPFWLVLGASLNRGWAAKADGHDLGTSTLVDGYANGWLVQPSKSGAAMTITLDWAPQRIAMLAVPISGVAMIVCFGIIAAAYANDRRRRLAYATATGAAPVLRHTLLSRTLERRRNAIIGTVGAMTVAAALLVTPWAGIVVGAAVFLAIIRPTWRRGIRLAPFVIVAATACYVTLVQLVQDHPTGIQWPSDYHQARIPVLIALVLLAADGVIALVWHTELDDGGGNDIQ